MENSQTEVPSPEQLTQTKGTEPPISKEEIATSAVPSSGRRAAFRDIRRQLIDNDLSNPGVQKLLLAMLEEADTDRENLKPYVNLYHEADKKAAILSEQVKTQKALDIFFGVGIGLGGTIIGLAPFFGGVKPWYGVITALVGLSLIIGAIAGRIANKERLWMKVLANTNLMYFIVFDTTYTSENAISNLQRHAYWFKPKEVKAGDYVILYTRTGIPNEQLNADGSTNHFLFWGLEKTIWNNKGDCAVLFQVNSWQTSKQSS
jgi:hypothetical protein